MILYLIRTTLCLVLMLVVYMLFLENEKMYRFNRIYLILSLIFSFLVPFIIIEGNSQAVAELSSRAVPALVKEYIIGTNATNTTTAADFSVTQHAIIKQQSLSTGTILLIIYGLITSVLVLRLSRNIYLILSRASNNERIPFHSAELVLLKNNIVSHTFWNYIFIDAEDYSNQIIEKEVFTHELAHAKQKHTLDILFIELLQAIFWFNPILILYRRTIQMNHEFLADEAVVLVHNDPKSYQLLLLNKIENSSKISLSSRLNYRITKKRLTMLALRSANRKTILIKELALAPIVLLAVFLFSTKVIARDQVISKIQRIINHSSLLPHRDPEVAKTDEVADKVEADKPVINLPDAISDNEGPVRISAVDGLEKLGKSPLVMINNKETDPDILYRINRSALANTNILLREEAVKKYGDKANDGAVEITTGERGLVSFNPWQAAGAVAARMDPANTKFYNRFVFKSPGGSLYDVIVLAMPNGARASCWLTHDAKAIFFFDGAAHEESEIANLNSSEISGFDGFETSNFGPMKEAAVALGREFLIPGTGRGGNIAGSTVNNAPAGGVRNNVPAGGGVGPGRGGAGGYVAAGGIRSNNPAGGGAGVGGGYAPAGGRGGAGMGLGQGMHSSIITRYPDVDVSKYEIYFDLHRSG